MVFIIVCKVTFWICDLKLTFESNRIIRYFSSDTTHNFSFSPATETSVCIFVILDLEKNIATVLFTLSFRLN